MKKKLFQYAVLLHTYETVDNKEVYKDTEIIIEPTVILAEDQNEVQFKIVRLIPEEKAKNPRNVEIAIKPF